jgi:phage tail-like protein
MPVTMPTAEDTRIPYGNFAFHVAFEGVDGGCFTPGEDVDEVLFGGFSEITGLEATMEHKVIKSGGRNYGSAIRAGPVSFGTVILKRGIVQSRHLWRWWSMFAGADNQPDGRPIPANRCNVSIGLISTIGSDPGDPQPDVRVGWLLRNAMPVKFRAGDLNAKGTDVAIEELHLVHEGLEMKDVVA